MVLSKTLPERLKTWRRACLGVLTLLFEGIIAPSGFGFVQQTQPTAPLSSFIQPFAGGFGSGGGQPNQPNQPWQQNPQQGQPQNWFTGFANQVGQAVGQAVNGSNNPQGQSQQTNLFGFPVQQNQQKPQGQSNNPFYSFGNAQKQNNNMNNNGNGCCCCPYCRNNPNNQFNNQGTSAGYRQGVPQTNWGTSPNSGPAAPSGSYTTPQNVLPPQYYANSGFQNAGQYGNVPGNSMPQSVVQPQYGTSSWRPYPSAQVSQPFTPVSYPYGQPSYGYNTPQTSVNPFDREAVPKEVYDAEMGINMTR